MSVVSLLIAAGVVWTCMFLCALLVLAAVMRSSQISQAEEPNSLPESSAQNKSEMERFAFGNL